MPQKTSLQLPPRLPNPHKDAAATVEMKHRCPQRGGQHHAAIGCDAHRVTCGIISDPTDDDDVAPWYQSVYAEPAIVTHLGTAQRFAYAGYLLAEKLNLQDKAEVGRRG